MTLIAGADAVPPRPHPVLRALARGVYRLIASTRLLTRWFLVLLGAVLRATPMFPLKGNILNSVRSYPWPDVELPARMVNLCRGVQVKMIPHVGEFDFHALLSRDLSYETEVFEHLLSRIAAFDAIVEVGANVGVYTLFFAKTRNNPAVPIYAFEPSQKAFMRLLKNIDGEPAIHPLPVAVAQQAGVLEFHEPRGHLTNGSLVEGFARAFDPEAHKSLVGSIDGVALARMVRHHDRILLKVDVEGAEAQVLRTLGEFIARKRPVIVLEVLESFADELNTLGLAASHEFWLITPIGLQRRDTLVADARHRDYLLVPRRSS